MARVLKLELSGPGRREEHVQMLSRGNSGAEASKVMLGDVDNHGTLSLTRELGGTSDIMVESTPSVYRFYRQDQNISSPNFILSTFFP